MIILFEMIILVAISLKMSYTVQQMNEMNESMKIFFVIFVVGVRL